MLRALRERKSITEADVATLEVGAISLLQAMQFDRMLSKDERYVLQNAAVELLQYQREFQDSEFKASKQPSVGKLMELAR